MIVKQQSINDIDCSNSNQQTSSKDPSKISVYEQVAIMPQEYLQDAWKKSKFLNFLFLNI
jgi:hypothetical protein